MKKAILLLIVILSVSNIFAQKEKQEADTTKIKLGNKTIIIIENDEKKEKVDLEIKVAKDEDETITEDEDVVVKNKENKEKYNSREFSRWAGINLGFNQFARLSDLSGLNSDLENWSINPWKSRTWNINILEFNISLIKKHLLLTTGLGFEFRKYSFNNNIDIMYDEAGNTVPGINFYIDYSKNTLSASYVQIPLLLEINTSSKPKKGLYLASGIIGGYKMSSKHKQKYEVNNQNIEKEIHDDFNLNPYQLEGTLRIGVNRFTIFTNVDILPVFKEGKLGSNDDLANITFGIQLIGF